MTPKQNIKDKIMGCLYGQAIGDADTNAVIACAILGAKFGYHSIPIHYIENLHNATLYATLSNEFIRLALHP